METLIEDMLALARQGQPITDTEEVQLASLTQQCWEVVDTIETTLTIEVKSDFTVEADSDRLQQLLETCFATPSNTGERT